MFIPWRLAHDVDVVAQCSRQYHVQEIRALVAAMSVPDGKRKKIASKSVR